MKNFMLFVLAGLGILTFTSCASIVSSGNSTLTINTNPPIANVTITNSKGVNVYEGFSPITVSLSTSESYFKKASYNLTISKEGFRTINYPITTRINEWYFGNIFFGGVIGFLIVDPLTGAMYKLDDEVILGELVALEEGTADAASLKIFNVNEIPEQWKSKLHKLTP